MTARGALARVRLRRSCPIEGPGGHVVVVGAGLAGLATAMRLAGAGRKVTVLERGATAGGRAAPLELLAPGGGTYRFDPGPTVLTMPDLIHDCFDALGEHTADWLQLHRVDPAYRATFADGSTLRVFADPARMRQEIAEVCGDNEAAGYDRFVAVVSQMYRLQIRDFIDRNLDSPVDLLGVNLARLAALGGFGRLAPFVARYLKDPRTQRLFSFQALYAGVSPQQALAIYAVISYMDSVAGVYSADGGMSAVPAAMAAAAAAHGVEFRYNTEVVGIERSPRRAIAALTHQGERIAADAFVLTPDLPVAYRDLLGSSPAALSGMRYSPSCYLLLAGADRRYPGTAHHNIHFGAAWDEVFEDLGNGRLMRDPSLLVSVPTVSDPSLAPSGRQTYYILAPTPNTTANLNWDQLAPVYRHHVLATLAKRGYPGLADSIEVENVTTPQDWQNRGMEAGTPFAAAHTFAQTGPFRPGNRWGENVVFAGSGTQPGVGVPMVLISGRLAAERILGADPGYQSRAWRS